MINLNEIEQSPNKFFDGQLKDGRLVELKVHVPKTMDSIARLIVAMSNADGGFILFGIDERDKSVVGVAGNCSEIMRRMERDIDDLSVGVKFSLSEEIVDDKNVIVLEIENTTVR